MHTQVVATLDRSSDLVRVGMKLTVDDDCGCIYPEVMGAAGPHFVGLKTISVELANYTIGGKRLKQLRVTQVENVLINFEIGQQASEDGVQVDSTFATLLESHHTRGTKRGELADCPMFDSSRKT